MMKIENSLEFHPELYALSMGVQIMADTYTGCIVNGVRFMVASRDANVQHKTQGLWWRERTVRNIMAY